MIINKNLHAINLSKILKFKNWETSKRAEKVTSGQRINRAGDDAAGLAVTEKMNGQIRGLFQAEKNTEDGMSMVQTAEGYLEVDTEILQRIRVLAIQSANGTYSANDRKLMQAEVNVLIDEIDRVASQAEFNKMKLLTGDFSRTNMRASLWFHMGPNMHHREIVYIGTMTSRGLKLQGPAGIMKVNITSADMANETIGVIEDAMTRLNKQRADLGAYYTRFDNAAKNLMNAYASVHSASSLLRDADVAEEMVQFTRDQIISQSGSAMLAQANANPSVIARILWNTPIFT